MKEQIPPILRPEAVSPVSLEQFAKQFNLLVKGDADSVSLFGISMNTSDLRPGDLFVAMPGKKTHGANFIARAVELGAVAVVTDKTGTELLGQLEIPILELENPRERLGELAAYVYGNVPGNMPKLFGTTGTNGKTSTSYLLEGILRQLGEVTGLTSTAERHIAGEVIVSRLTTPESPEMQALIARMREKGVTAVAIEVSAQALSQLRVDGLQFDVVGFTNLSHDHLDDYKDMQEYLEAKLPLFTKKHASRGVVCLDTKYGKDFVRQSEIPVVTITSELGVDADWHVAVTAETPSYTSFVLAGPDGVTIRSRVPLLGAHMAANAGLAVAMLVEAGFAPEAISKAIEIGIEAYLPGRTERVTGETGPDVYVDFGHSPDAFFNTLSAVRKVTDGKLFMVFGADGDRDASKRPAMAQVAAEGCDVLIITDHHPRFEDPASIRKSLLDSARQAKPNLEIYEISPPEAAIRKAVSMAKPGDAILWAGPGHQDYRDIRGVRTPYSARHEAREALKENGWS
jgi:UDP-N-acetylmuramoyl-L-alanyl-D-glutamate--2,6-diaminopimelate ligase